MGFCENVHSQTVTEERFDAFRDFECAVFIVQNIVCNF